MLVTTWFAPFGAVETAPLLQSPSMAGVPAIIGPPGASGSGPPFEHQQMIAAVEWIVNHNKGFRPLVEVLSPGGIAVAAEVRHISDNQVRIYFNQPQTGQVLAR